MQTKISDSTLLLIITINIMDCCGAITFSIMTRGKMTFGIMAFGITKLAIRAFGKVALAILTISIITIV